MLDDLPGNWTQGIGEASRPLSEGGYYDKWLYRTLPGSNQHVERYLELHLYGEPDRHSLELHRCRETGDEIIRDQKLEQYTTHVARDSRDDPDIQQDAEHSIEQQALSYMRGYLEYTPPLQR